MAILAHGRARRQRPRPSIQIFVVRMPRHRQQSEGGGRHAVAAAVRRWVSHHEVLGSSRTLQYGASARVPTQPLPPPADSASRVTGDHEPVHLPPAAAASGPSRSGCCRRARHCTTQLSEYSDAKSLRTVGLCTLLAMRHNAPRMECDVTRCAGRSTGLMMSTRGRVWATRRRRTRPNRYCKEQAGRGQVIGGSTTLLARTRAAARATGNSGQCVAIHFAAVRLHRCQSSV